MQLLRVFHAKRVVVCLGLLGSLALASGCGESNPATSVSDDEAKAKTQAQRDAMQNAFGKNGAPTGARPSAKK
jgi:hypothetical protein